MTPSPIGWHNGEYRPLAEISLSLDDIGVTQGVVITDRVRSFHREWYRLDDHIRRFFGSCELARVPLRTTSIQPIAEELLERNRDGGAREWTLILIATPGPPRGEPTLILQIVPLDFARLRAEVGRELRLDFSPASMPPSLIDPHIKTRSRLHWWIGDAEFRRTRAPDVAPLYTLGGFIRETAIANFLAVIRGVLTSPPRATILDGISLQVVRELADICGIPFREREIATNEVESMSEAMLVNTSYCLVGVAFLAERRLSGVGEVGRALLGEWNRRVGLDIHAQIFSE